MFGFSRLYVYGALGFATFLALLAWHKIETRRAFNAGVASEQTKARVEAGNRIIEMEKNDEGFRKLPALDRCRLFMRDSGLPEHHCDQR
jgi:hypothetical protein